jgi:hypothetical protein
VILKALMGWDINFGVMVLFGDDFGVLMVFFVLTCFQYHHEPGYPTRKKKLKNEHILQASSGWS